MRNIAYAEHVCLRFRSIVIECYDFDRDGRWTGNLL